MKRTERHTHLAVRPRLPSLVTGLLIALTSLGLSFAQVGHETGEMTSSHMEAEGNLTSYTADYRFTLETALLEGQMVFVGVGGALDGQVNPTLHVRHGAVVEITLMNGDGIEHDIGFPEVEAMSDHTRALGDTVVVAFRADDGADAHDETTLQYYCTFPGHRIAGMEGLIAVSNN